MNRTLARRLETLEQRVIPEEEPSVMEVVFIDAATKQPTERLQLKLGVRGTIAVSTYHRGQAGGFCQQQ